MSAINHVLVPTDGSAGALKAAAFAATLCRALGARATALFVQSEELVIPAVWSGAGGSMDVEETRSMLEQRVREKELRETLQALGNLDHERSSMMVWGHPADEICRFAAAHDVDLVVIGSHGRSGLKRMLLGSVSNAVANRAPCPVTIVR